jgi:hypothetical protein
MEPAERERVVSELARAFGAAADVTPAPGQPLHVLLPALDMPEPWRPSPARALTIWADWPVQRPQVFIDEAVVGESGGRPRSHSLVYQLGEPWTQFSFAFAWTGRDPARAVQHWMTRFVKERS